MDSADSTKIPLGMDERSARIERRLERPLLIAALLTIPAILIEGSNTGSNVQAVASVLNWVIWTAFAAEVIVMLALVPDRRAWVRAHPLELAIVVLTPPFGPAALQSARALRLLRLLRLFMIAKLLSRLATPGGLRWATMSILLIALGSAGAFVAVERSAQPGLSVWDGLWWTVTTVTTVGYGDLSPQTDAGRAIAMVVMFSGIGFVAMLTAAVAEKFVRRDVEAEVEVASAGHDEVLARLDEICERLERLERLER